LLSAVGVENVSSPVVGPDQTVLVDLEPRASRILGSIADLGKIDNDRAVVVTSNSLVAAGSVTWLLMHLNSNGTTSCDGTDTSNTDGSTEVTLDIGGGDAGHWRVAAWLTNTGTALVNAIDPELLEGGVGRSSRDSGQKASEEGKCLHFGLCWIDSGAERLRSELVEES